MMSGMEKKLWEFEKKGDVFTVWLDENHGDIWIELRGVKSRAEIHKHPEHGWGYGVRYGDISELLTGKKDRAVMILHESAERAAVAVNEWKAAKEAAENAAREAEIAAIKSGEKTIHVKWHDGEYLSGYEAFGWEAHLLSELGLAKQVSGWGYLVSDGLVRALGKEFTYQQAVEFIRPKLNEKARKEAEEAQKREDEEARLRPMSAEREAQYRAEVGPIRRVASGEGPDYECEIITISPEGRRMKFIARNLFDAGLVISRPAGGAAYRNREGKWCWATMDGDVEMAQEEAEHCWVARKNVPASLRGTRM